MAAKKLLSLRCPTCKKLVLKEYPEFPFCSERCRTIDLGRWVSGDYVISTPVDDPESGGETEYQQPPSRRNTHRNPEKTDEDIGENFYGSRKPQ